MFVKILKFKNALLRIDSRTIYLYSLLTGMVTGCVAILFHKAFELLSYLIFDLGLKTSLADLRPNSVHFFTWPKSNASYILLVLPALGGLLVGLIIHFWSSDAKGSGVDDFLEAFHNRGGVLNKRTPFAKFFASLLTISSGGSGGKEGPMLLIGSGIGSLFGKFIRMGARAQRTLFLAGAAGGLGAIFRTPLGGAITAIEILYKEDFETDSLVPCIISSVTAYTTFAAYVGFGHVFAFKSVAFHSPLELIFYVVLGLVCTVGAYVFVKIFHGSKVKIFERVKCHPILKPALGGLMVGLLGFFYPEVLSDGLQMIQRLVSQNYTGVWWHLSLFFLFLAVLKMVATAFTLQSGGSAGSMVPSLFMGAMIGASYGVVMQHFFPLLVPDVTPFVIVGMAAFFAAVTNASLGTLVMVSELTGGYELLPPLMTVMVISLVLSHKWSLYSKQVKNKFFSRAHLYDMNPLALKDTRIDDTFRDSYHQTSVIAEHESLHAIRHKAILSHETDFVIVNDHTELVGILSLKDFLGEHEDIEDVQNLCVAKDLVTRKSFFVTEQDSLYKALQYLLDSDFDKVPVVREAVHVETGEPVMMFLGYIQYKDILRFYHTLRDEHIRVMPMGPDVALKSQHT